MSDLHQPSDPSPSQLDRPASRPEPVLLPSEPPGLPVNEEPGGIPPTTFSAATNPKEPLDVPLPTPQEMLTRTPSFLQPRA